MEAEPHVQSPTVFASSSPNDASVAHNLLGPVGVKNSPPFFPASEAKRPIRIMYAVPRTSNWESSSMKSISFILDITLLISSVLSDTASPKSGSCNFISLKSPEKSDSERCPIVEPVTSLMALSKSSTENLSSSFSGFSILLIRFLNRYSGFIIYPRASIDHCSIISLRSLLLYASSY